MNRLRLIWCAIVGHGREDYGIDYRPEYNQRWSRCNRCQTWSLHDGDLT